MNKLTKMMRRDPVRVSQYYRSWVDALLPDDIDSIDANYVEIQTDNGVTSVACKMYETDARTIKEVTNPDGIASIVTFCIHLRTSKQQRVILDYLKDRDVESVYTIQSRSLTSLNPNEKQLRDWLERGTVRCTAHRDRIVNVPISAAK